MARIIDKLEKRGYSGQPRTVPVRCRSRSSARVSSGNLIFVQRREEWLTTGKEIISHPCMWDIKSRSLLAWRG
jgi:hypothetical protein